MDTLRTSYLAPLFGGKERIIATMKSFVAIADTDTVVVRVPNLVQLPSGQNNLVTHTSLAAAQRHALINSDYGLPPLIGAVARAVRQYAASMAWLMTFILPL